MMKSTFSARTTILIFSPACAPYWPGIAGSGSDNSIRMPSGSCGGCNARTSGGERADKQPSRATKQQLALNIHSISLIPSCIHLGNHPFSLSNFIQESKPTRVTQQVKKIPVMDFSISFAQSHLTTLSEGILARETSWFGLGLDIQKQ